MTSKPLSRIDELSTELLDVLNDEIAEIATAIDDLKQARADRIQQRNELVKLFAPCETPAPERVQKKAAKKPAATSATETFDCQVDGCDRSFDTKQGVTMHQRRAHGKNWSTNGGGDAPKAAPSLRPRRPKEITDSTLACRCEEVDCGEAYETATQLNQHTVNAHGRTILQIEKMPRRADG